MKKTTKITALIAAVICAAAGMSSCAASVTYPVTVDGEPIRAGIYIYEKKAAISDATTKFGEENEDTDTSADDFDYLKQSVEGVSFSTWVDNKTDDYCREYMAVERLFSEYGLTVDPIQEDSINSETKSLWTEENQYAQYFYGVSIAGEYFEKQGIGQQSYKDCRLNAEKKTELFDYLYTGDGPQAVSEAEINEVIGEKYAAANYFLYELGDENGAQSYVDRINAGESYEEVYLSYAEEKERRSIQQQMDEAAANGEEYEGESLDSVSFDLPAEDSMITTFEKDSESPSAEFVAEVFAMASGETKVISVTTGEGDGAATDYYVVSKVDILTKPSLTESYRDTIIHEKKDDEFDELIKNKASGLTLTSDSSKNMYSTQVVMNKG